VDLLFWSALIVLTVISAGLAWLGLQKARPLTPPPAPDRRGFLALAAEHGLQAQLDGLPATWGLHGQVDGRSVAVRVVEVEGQRWTEARLGVTGLSSGLRCASRALGARSATPTGLPAVDAALAVWTDDAGLDLLQSLWADEGCLRAWLALLGPEDGAAVDDGALVWSVEGVDSTALRGLLARLGEGVRAMGI